MNDQPTPLGSAPSLAISDTDLVTTRAEVARDTSLDQGERSAMLRAMDRELVRRGLA